MRIVRHSSSLSAAAAVSVAEPSAVPVRTPCVRAVPLDSPILALALLVVAAELVFLAFWPGIVHWDMSQIVAEAHSGSAVDWWTGLGTVAMHAWFAVGLGLPLLWAGVVAANIAGIYGCLRVVLRRVPAASATLACVIFPPVYGQLAALSRDSACVGFTLLALAALARWTGPPARGRRRWLLGAFAFALCAASLRQNGISVVMAVTLCGVLAARPVTRRRLLGAALAAIVVGAAVFGMLRTAMPALGVRSVDPERMTFVYDLAALSASGRDRFPQRALRALPPGGAAPADTGEAVLRRKFRPWGITSVRGVAQMDVENVALAGRETPLLRGAWLHAISQEPLAYLGERLRLYTTLLGIAGQPANPPPGFFYGYQRLETPDNYGHPLADPSAYGAASDVLGRFIGPRAIVPLDRPWVYLVVLATALGYLWRRRVPALRPAAAIAVAAAINQLLLIAAVMAASFRYEYLLVPGAAVCLAYALAAAGRGRSRLLRGPD